MKLTRQILVLLFWSLFLEFSFGQDFIARTYTTNDGLPGNYLFSVTQCFNGYLWTGSTNGFSRFDGTTFRNFGIDVGLTSLYVREILDDKTGYIWAGSQSEIVRTRHGIGKMFPVEDSAKINFTFDILRSPDGKIWWLTDKGIYEFTDDQWKKKPSHLTNASPRQVVMAEGKTYYNYGDRIIIERGGKEFTVGLADHPYTPYYRLIRACNDHVYVQTNSSLAEVTETGLQYFFEDELNEAKDIFLYWFLQDSRGIWWLATNKGLWISAPHKSNIVQRIRLNNQIVSDILEDKAGNIWLATGEGLVKVSRSYSTKDITLPQLTIATSYVRNNGDVLIGAINDKEERGGIFQVINNAALSIKGTEKLNDELIDGYAEDDSQNLWMSTRSGTLYKVTNGSMIKIFQENGWIPELKFNTKENRLYICGSYLYTLQQGIVKSVLTDKGDSISNPFSIFFDHFNNKWITQRNGIILLLKPDGKLMVMNKQLGVQMAASAFIREDNQGNIWLAYQGHGLKRYSWNNDKLTFDFDITTKTGLPNAFIKSFLVDKNDNLWVVTHHGPVFINLKNSYGDNYYSITNLMQQSSSESVWWRSEFKNGIKGEVILSANHTLYFYRPADLQINNTPPKTVVEKVTIKTPSNIKAKDSVIYVSSKPSSLSYNFNNLVFNFHAVSLSQDPLLFSWQLNGADTLWSQPSNNTNISFVNLEPGSYTFRVKARHLNTDWSLPASLSFTILPPIWKTWWFRLVAGILILTLVAGLLIWYVRGIKLEEEAARQLKDLELRALRSQMNPHFIFNAMNSIQALIADQKPAEALKYTSKFSKLLRSVLENSEKNLISLDNEIAALELYVQIESLRLNFELNYSIHIDPSISPEIELIPPMVIQPYVENALWHGLSNKEIDRNLSIKFSVTDLFLFCEIMDNGVGRIKSKELRGRTKSESRGHSISERRLTLINNVPQTQAVEIIDLYNDANEATGTKVTLTILRNSTR